MNSYFGIYRDSVLSATKWNSMNGFRSLQKAQNPDNTDDLEMSKPKIKSASLGHVSMNHLQEAETGKTKLR